MKKQLFRLTSLVLFVATLAACGEDPLGYDDDEDATQPVTGSSEDGTGVKGTPQSSGVPAGAGAVSGKINGKEWAYVSGSARTSTYSSGRSTLNVRLVASEGGEESCPYDEPKRSWVNAGYVRIAKNSGPAADDNYPSAGLHFFDEKTDEDEADYAYDDEIALEITEQTATRVSGSVKITVGNSHAVSGTFSVPFCAD